MRNGPYHRRVDDIVERLRRAAPAVLAQQPVAVAYLFGSHARGQAGPLSDVDVALLAPTVEPHDRLDLRLRISGRLADVARLPTLDVIVLDESPLVLAGEVVRDGVVIHSVDEGLRSEYESRIFREFVDFSMFGDAFAREALRLIAQGLR